MLELVNLSKSYAGGQVKAVDNISLSARKGEIFGFSTAKDQRPAAKIYSLIKGGIFGCR